MSTLLQSCICDSQYNIVKMELITVALAGLVIILLFIYSQSKDPLSAIPGPFRLPIFGNIQFNFPKLHRQFTEFASRYGDVYRIQILSQPCIVINSYEAMREAYQKRGKDFIGRPHMLRFERMYATNGIAFRVSVYSLYYLDYIMHNLNFSKHSLYIVIQKN